MTGDKRRTKKAVVPKEKAKERPKDFEELSPQEQWDIDKELGILDWDGR